MAIRRSDPSDDRSGMTNVGAAESLTSRSRIASLLVRCPRAGEFHQRLVRIDAVATGHLGPALGAKLPGEGAVLELEPQDLLQVRREGVVEDRCDALDPVVEVALHQVGGPDVIPGASPIAAEPEDPRMLEEAADQRAHADVVRQAGYARPQAARTADDQIDARPRGGCR